MSDGASGGLTLFQVAALALAIGGGAFLVWRGQSKSNAPVVDAAMAPADAAKGAIPTAPAPAAAAPTAEGEGAPDAGADAVPFDQVDTQYLLDSSKSGGGELIIPGLE